MGFLRDFVEHVAESFTTLFNLDVDPALTEHENVERVIAQTATVASIVSMVQPIPAADFLILTPIQAKMALHIGRMKGFQVTQERAQEIVVEVVGVLGMTLTAQLLIVSVAKLLPIVGGMLSVPLIYAATWAIGNVVDYYFDCLRSDQRPSAEVMKDLFKEQFRVGKQKGQALDKTELQRKAEELRRKVAERDEDLTTETRLDPRESDRRPQASAASSAAAAAAAPTTDGARRKIKITLGGGERDPREPRKAEPAPDPGRARGKKTIGPEVVAPPDEPAAPASASSRKTMGAPAAPAAPVAPVAPPPVVAEAPAAAATVTAAAKPSFVDQLERLGRLRDLGVLSPDEFDQAKRKILGL